MIEQLREPFPAKDIQWRAGATNKEKTKALALAYIDARAVMDRLDEVCGPANWQNEIISGHGGIITAGIAIKIDGEWVWKWDGAGQTDFEGEKGGISSAIKRAAVQWGIGRYLYNIPAVWVKCEQKGKSVVLSETPRLPSWALPNDEKSSPQKLKEEIGIEPTRPYAPDVLKEKIEMFAKKYRNEQKRCTDADRKIVASRIDSIFGGDTTKRYELCKWLVGSASTSEMGAEYINSLKAWMSVEGWDEPSDYSKQEAINALPVALKASGQLEMEMN